MNRQKELTKTDMQQKEIIKKAQQGDRQAMEQLYNDSMSMVYAYIMSQVHNKEITEDLVSKVYVKAFSKIQQFKGKSSFKTWVYAIARNELYAYYNAKAKSISTDAENIDYLKEHQVNALDHTTDKLEDNEPKEDKTIIRKVAKVLQHLPEKYAEILRLRYLMNYSLVECAESLGIKPNYAKVLHHRALKKAAKLNYQEL